MYIFFLHKCTVGQFTKEKSSQIPALLVGHHGQLGACYTVECRWDLKSGLCVLCWEPLHLYPLLP